MPTAESLPALGAVADDMPEWLSAVGKMPVSLPGTIHIPGEHKKQASGNPEAVTPMRYAVRPRHVPLKEACPEHWCWNKKDRSQEVKLYGNRHLTAHFHPNWSNGTAGVRGTQVLNYGVHYWEINISQRIFGTSMMFGIGTKKARLHVDAFVNLIGEDEHSWGLSHKGLLWHNGKWRQFTKPFRENESTCVGILFNWFEGTLTFYKDGVFLGIAFTGMNRVHEELFPIVCSTAAKTEMSLGLTLRGFTSLQDRCRAIIAKHIDEDNEIDILPLPNKIKAYIKELLPC